MKEIVCLHGEILQVSDEDFAYMSLFSWSVSPAGYARYARRIDKKRKEWFAHVVVARRAGISTSKDVEHKDRKPLNCQRENLRAATRSQNVMNTTPKPNCASKYKGVTWHKGNGKWQASLKRNGRTLHLGLFDSEISAARQYDFVARKYFGEFAYLNFPEGQ